MSYDQMPEAQLEAERRRLIAARNELREDPNHDKEELEILQRDIARLNRTIGRRQLAEQSQGWRFHRH